MADVRKKFHLWNVSLLVRIFLYYILISVFSVALIYILGYFKGILIASLFLISPPVLSLLIVYCCFGLSAEGNSRSPTLLDFSFYFFPGLVFSVFTILSSLFAGYPLLEGAIFTLLLAFIFLAPVTYMGMKRFTNTFMKWASFILLICLLLFFLWLLYDLLFNFHPF